MPKKESIDCIQTTTMCRSTIQKIIDTYKFNVKNENCPQAAVNNIRSMIKQDNRQKYHPDIFNYIDTEEFERQVSLKYLEHQLAQSRATAKGSAPKFSLFQNAGEQGEVNQDLVSRELFSAFS